METAALDSATSQAAAPVKQSKGKPTPLAESPNSDNVRFELGLWLSGIETFLTAGNHAFVDKDRPKAIHDWTKEVRLTHSTLLLCAKLNYELLKSLEDQESDERGNGSRTDVTVGALNEFSLVLKDVILLSETLIRAEPLKFGIWKAWSNVLSEKLKMVPVVGRLISYAESVGEDNLPDRLKQLMEKGALPFADHSDLRLVLPRFAKTLKWLTVVGRMLENDEPLKPALLIFSRVHEQTREMIDYVNNRLSRFPNEDAELFGSLDGASYTASLELRKVYDQDLTGIVAVRPSVSIYSRVETAYSLLNDSFQHILTGFARLMDPNVQIADLFPNSTVKLERSLELRKELWLVLKAVQEAEKESDSVSRGALQKKLGEFLVGPVNYLFSKDKESVERFVEEIGVTHDEKDLVGILHRFATYLETLFGQINMRTVLADHPFEAPKN
ncbi:MAG TPA: hypothetical protein VL325_00565 [Pyrinomonadaceae bacterium]|nr:hypothetical protein [Pyrinomonadaceae bacterium]